MRPSSYCQSLVSLAAGERYEWLVLVVQGRFAAPGVSAFLLKLPSFTHLIILQDAGTLKARTVRILKVPVEFPKSSKGERFLYCVEIVEVKVYLSIY